MSTGGFLLAAIAMVGFFVLRMVKYNTMGHRHPGNAPMVPSVRETQLEREVADLRKRLEVIERITTDEHQPRRIAAEIEALREPTN